MAWEKEFRPEQLDSEHFIINSLQNDPLCHNCGLIHGSTIEKLTLLKFSKVFFINWIKIKVYGEKSDCFECCKTGSTQKQRKVTVLTFKFSVAYKYVITRIGFSYKFSTVIPSVLRTERWRPQGNKPSLQIHQKCDFADSKNTGRRTEWWHFWNWRESK